MTKKITNQPALFEEARVSEPRIDKMTKDVGVGAKNNAKNKSFSAIQNIFSNYQLKKDSGHVTREFQDFGYRLAITLDDLAHKSLYIRMAKQVERGILERALGFVSDANAQNKARLFMWKVKKLRSGDEEKQ